MWLLPSRARHLMTESAQRSPAHTLKEDRDLVCYFPYRRPPGGDLDVLAPVVHISSESKPHQLFLWLNCFVAKVSQSKLDLVRQARTHGAASDGRQGKAWDI